MPAPRWLARANRVGFNQLMRYIAPRIPGHGVLEHRGRSSGRTYRTPVTVFRQGTRFVIAAAYGRESDWIRNVLAAGGCTLETRGQRIALHSPELVTDDQRLLVPRAVRVFLGVINVSHFLVLTSSEIG